MGNAVSPRGVQASDPPPANENQDPCTTILR